MNTQFPNGWKEGLFALEDDGHGNNYTNRIRLTDKTKLDGSFFIEGYFRPKYKGSARQPNYWDYAIGYDSVVYFVEIHPTDKTSRCTEVLEKFNWLESVVLPKFKNNTEINGMSFFWVSAGNKINFLTDSVSYRKLSQKKVKFVKMYLNLPSK